MNKKPVGSEMLVYQAPNGAIELKGDIEHETIWANRMQMAEMFGVNPQAITKHIQNIYSEGELEKEATSSKMELVQTEGDREVTREVNYYNLDVLISIGYRISSVTGTKFRQRATSTLRKHITQGYTINPNRVTQNYQAFLETVEEVKQLNSKKSLGSDQIVELIKLFAHTWFSLDAYDKEGFSSQGQTQQTISLQAKELYADIASLKEQLIAKGEATELFAQEKQKDSLAGILGNVFQTMGGEDVYPSIESKGAHLLYFIVKNHPFTDGNKRSGAFAFIRFLQKAGVAFRHAITPEALTALTLLVATSDPKDKKRVTELIILMLQGTD